MFKQLEALTNRSETLLEMAENYEQGTLDQAQEDRIVERVLEQVDGAGVDEESVRKVTREEMRNVFTGMLDSSEIYGAVGPYPSGEFHKNPGWGPHFHLSDSLKLESATVDAEAAGDMTTEIWEFDGEKGRQGTQPVTTVDHSVEKGLNRIKLDIPLPPGDYQIARAGNLPLRRITGWDGWEKGDHPVITFMGAGSMGDDYKTWPDYYHYYFDLMVAPIDQSEGEQAIRQATRDVAELYTDQLRDFIERGNRALDKL